jgi:hypothetical protein
VLQLKEPGFTVHWAMQVVLQLPVQETLAEPVHSASHSATTLRGVHWAEQPPVTSNEHSEIELRFGRNEHSAAHGLPAIAAEETSIRGAARRPTKRRDMDERMVVFS